jgi:hypothetical protein
MEDHECPACGFRGSEEEFGLTDDEQAACPECDATVHDIGLWWVGES